MVDGRGELSHPVANIARNRLGYEITQRELRLMPYLCHILVNSQEIDKRKVNDEELRYINNWLDKGWLYFDGAGFLQAEKVFFMHMQEIIYYGYVVYRNYEHLVELGDK